jgi:hypothetical protein
MEISGQLRSKGSLSSEVTPVVSGEGAIRRGTADPSHETASGPECLRADAFLVTDGREGPRFRPLYMVALVVHCTNEVAQ